MNDYDDRSAPCPVCGSTQRRGGFCCESCHAAYMSERHAAWNQPGTRAQRPDNDRHDLWVWSSTVRDIPRVQSRRTRPDPRGHTDEQSAGGWAFGVRALEDGATWQIECQALSFASPSR